MKMQLENYLVEVISGKQKGGIAFVIRCLLFVLSIPYRIAITIRNWAFDKGLLRRYCPPVPVVMSIGNIVVGGTGKTPATLMIAQEFYGQFQLAILSRGYRSQAERLAVPVILCKGEGPLQSAVFCGDEPFLLAQNLPKAHVIVGRDRHKSSDMAAKAGMQLILLDDGMQHRRLARDIEVVVMDMYDPYGQGHYFPRGLLREGVSSLKRAHLIILNHVGNRDEFEQVKKEIAAHSSAVVVGTKMEVVHVETLEGEVVPDVKGKKVGLFCGIAHPEYFERTVVGMQAEIVDSAIVPDHKSFDLAQLSAFAIQCREKGAELLLCTEKDKVKIDEDLNLVLPIAWVKMRLSVVEGKEAWDAFIERVKGLLQYST